MTACGCMPFREPVVVSAICKGLGLRLISWRKMEYRSTDAGTVGIFGVLGSNRSPAPNPAAWVSTRRTRHFHDPGRVAGLEDVGPYESHREFSASMRDRTRQVLIT
jgi:hypothetical protein